MYTIKNTTGGCGAKGASGAGIAPPGNPGDVLYLVSSGVAGAAANVLYTGDGNLYAANSVTTTNVFANLYYGDGGLLSNISSGGFTQPLANLVVSNSVTTTNIFATSANIATMNVGYLTVNSAVVYGTSTLNVYGTSNLTNVTVRDTFNVNGSMSANAANATFFFDTFTIPYINTQVLNVASNIILSGNLSAPLANITTLNVNYLTVNSAVVYGTSTLNVYGVSNLSTATMVGTSGKTTLNVTGNVYASNAVTTTNVFATRYYGDGGLLSNVFVQPFANLVVSNAVTTTNVFAVTANVGTLNVWQVSNLVSLSLSNNLYAANAVTTTNVFTANVTATGVQTIAGLTGLTSLNVTGNVYVSNAVTATSHYGNVSASNVVVTPATGVTGISVTGNLYASNAVTATSHYGNVSASNVVVTPATGVTGISVTGNLYASNAVTTTNVFTTNVTATNVTGTSLIGTHYGVLAGSNTVSASSATFTTAFGQTANSTLTLVDGTRSLNFDVNAGAGNYNSITGAGDQLIWGSAGSINTGTLTIAPHNTGTVGVRIGSTSNIVTIASNVTTFQSNGAAAVMTLTSGRIGVGITAPGGLFQVNAAVVNPTIPTVHIGDNVNDYGATYGMVHLVRSATPGDTKAHMTLIRNGQTGVNFGFYNNTNTFGIWRSLQTTASTPTIAIDSVSDLVGIGKVAGYTLDVNGDINASSTLRIGGLTQPRLISSGTFTGVTSFDTVTFDLVNYNVVEIRMTVYFSTQNSRIMSSQLLDTGSTVYSANESGWQMFSSGTTASVAGSGAYILNNTEIVSVGVGGFIVVIRLIGAMGISGTIRNHWEWTTTGCYAGTGASTTYGRAAIYNSSGATINRMRFNLSGGTMTGKYSIINYST